MSVLSWVKVVIKESEVVFLRPARLWCCFLALSVCIGFPFSSRQKPGRFTDSAAPHQRIILSQRSRFQRRVLKKYQRISQSQLSMRWDDGAKWKNHLEGGDRCTVGDADEEAAKAQSVRAPRCRGGPSTVPEETPEVARLQTMIHCVNSLWSALNIRDAARELTGLVSSFFCSKHHLDLMNTVVYHSDCLIQSQGSNIYLSVCQRQGMDFPGVFGSWCSLLPPLGDLWYCPSGIHADFALPFKTKLTLISVHIQHVRYERKTCSSSVF